MGYVVVIQEKTSPEMTRPGYDGCFVMDEKRTWSSRYRSKLLDPESINKIWVFTLKETAEREVARIMAGDRQHGPDPEGTVEVVHVEDGYPEPKERHGDFVFDFGIVKAIRTKSDLHRWEVYLPHSCDEWVIGNADEVQAMINQLEMAKKMLLEDKAALAEK